MERASPYEHPSTAIEEVDPPIRFIDPRGTTRFLQVFLVLRICGTTLAVTLPLALMQWAIVSPLAPWTLTPQFNAFVGATTIVTTFALGAWLWVSQRNQLALRRGAAHHWAPLMLAGFGLLSLHSFYALDQLRPFTLAIAAFALISTAYIGYFLHRALQADAPRSQGTRLVLSFRLWLIATAGAILVPSILVWRSIHFPNAEFDYRHYSRLGFCVFALASELSLLAVVARLAKWQRETHAFMQGVAPTPVV
jgi:hypothetical protein